jgi:hypothetical protein
MQVDQRHAQMDINLQKEIAFNEKLNKLLEETQKKKPFNYDFFFGKIMNYGSIILCIK